MTHKQDHPSTDAKVLDIEQRGVRFVNTHGQDRHLTTPDRGPSTLSPQFDPLSTSKSASDLILFSPHISVLFDSLDDNEQQDSYLTTSDRGSTALSSQFDAEPT
jgi:hypothetical protein